MELEARNELYPSSQYVEVEASTEQLVSYIYDSSPCHLNSMYKFPTVLRSFRLLDIIGCLPKLLLKCILVYYEVSQSS